jgi:hypothetical protein
MCLGASDKSTAVIENIEIHTFRLSGTTAWCVFHAKLMSFLAVQSVVQFDVEPYSELAPKL